MTREQVMAGVVAACRNILVANGYNTNAGQRVYRFAVGADVLETGDFPCVVVADSYQPDAVQPTAREVDQVKLPLEVFGLARQEESWRNSTLPTKLNDLRADLKKALTTRAVFGSNSGELRRLGAEPVYDHEHPVGFVSMRVELAFSEA